MKVFRKRQNIYFVGKAKIVSPIPTATSDIVPGNDFSSNNNVNHCYSVKINSFQQNSVFNYKKY